MISRSAYKQKISASTEFSTHIAIFYKTDFDFWTRKYRRHRYIVQSVYICEHVKLGISSLAQFLFVCRCTPGS